MLIVCLPRTIGQFYNEEDGIFPPLKDTIIDFLRGLRTYIKDIIGYNHTPYMILRDIMIFRSVQTRLPVMIINQIQGYSLTG